MALYFLWIYKRGQTPFVWTCYKPNHFNLTNLTIFAKVGVSALIFQRDKACRFALIRALSGEA